MLLITTATVGPRGGKRNKREKEKEGRKEREKENLGQGERDNGERGGRRRMPPEPSLELCREEQTRGRKNRGGRERMREVG